MSSGLSKNDPHVGRLVLKELSRNGKAVCVVDAGTGQSETKESVLKRSTALAKCMRRFGMKPNEVVNISGRSHIDVRIPYYAGLMLGCPIAALDPLFKLGEIKTFFSITKPKITFCQQDRYEDNVAAARELGLSTRVVTFEDGEHSFKRFLEEFDGDDDEEFQVTEIDPTSTYAWLVPTSGTTGVPKVAAFLHSMVSQLASTAFPSPDKKGGIGWLATAPIYWVSSYILGLTVLLQDSFVLQSSSEVTSDHLIDMINTYRPVAGLLNPNHISGILRSPKHCDFNCFKGLILGGSKVHYEIIEEIRRRCPDAGVFEAYGQTEMIIQLFHSTPEAPPGSVGKQFPNLKIKLVDPETQEEITEPNKTGELWVLKKDVRFHCYYNMPEETARAFTPDGYYKTGDLLYHDEDGNYYFVDRLKMMMKYRGTHILPIEIEEVIRSHPSVSEVVALSIPDPERGDLPVACVVVQPNCCVPAEELKKMVRDRLSVNKQLYGGVVFLKELPRTSTGKVALGVLKDIVLNAKRE